jgi:hypothetical protein
MIWKSVLKATDVQKIEVPAGAEILCAREQHDQICVWYRFEQPERLPREERTIAIVGTGNPGPHDGGRFLGTCSIMNGEFMFHVFLR